MSLSRTERPGGPSGSLAQLLAAEARFDERLAEARDRAAREVAAARERARDAVARVGAELEALEARDRADRARALEERRAAIEGDAAGAAARLDGLSDARIHALADWVVEQVVDVPAERP